MLRKAAISVIGCLYVASLMLVAFKTTAAIDGEIAYSENWTGLKILALGWAGLLDGTIGWYANIALVLAIAFLRIRPVRS